MCRLDYIRFDEDRRQRQGQVIGRGKEWGTEYDDCEVDRIVGRFPNHGGRGIA